MRTQSNFCLLFHLLKSSLIKLTLNFALDKFCLRVRILFCETSTAVTSKLFSHNCKVLPPGADPISRMLGLNFLK